MWSIYPSCNVLSTGTKVNAVNYEVGDYVEAGSVVVEFDSDDYAEKLNDQKRELEKAKVKDEVRLEIINVATLVAGKFVEEEMDSAKQEQLLKETLEEIGEDTWQN